MLVLVSNVCHAFDVQGIGTRVIDETLFWDDFNIDMKHAQFSDKGTAYVSMTSTASVSAGVGLRSTSAEDYVLRSHRGRVEAYLRRQFAAPVESLGVVVYTREAYLSDPDVAQDAQELSRVQGSPCELVVVAVLASAGPKAPVTPYRFCHNVAGGNIEYNDFSKEKLVELAKESLAYDAAWCVVAD